MQPNLPRAPFSAGDFLDFQAQSKSFEQLAAMHRVNFTMTGRGIAERLPGMVVTPNFFTTLGIQPIVGRAFLPREARLGRSEWRCWRTDSGSRDLAATGT